MPLERVLKIASALFVVLLCSALFAVYVLHQRARANIRLAEQNHIFLELTHELTESSRQLTQAVRLYTVTQKAEYEARFWNIFRQRSGEIPRPEKCAVSPGVTISLLNLLQQYAPSQNDYALVHRAFVLSEKLVEIEKQAMDAAKGIQDKNGTVIHGEPDWEHARFLVFSPVYQNWQKEILDPLQNSLIQVRRKYSNYISDEYHYTSIITTIFIGILIFILLIIIFISLYIRNKYIIPFNRIIQFSTNIMRGQVDKRCTESSSFEAEKLSQSFNFLLDKLEEEKNRSSTDALTHLYNRRYYDKKLQELREDQEESHPVFSLLSIDIDFFKKINDTFGHVYGDEVLKSFALILKECSRSDDLLARVGGEEFVILAHGDSNQAYQLAERIRKAVEERLILPDCRAVTCSIGIAQYRSGMELAILQGNADNALYQAKQNGRNRVCISQCL